MSEGMGLAVSIPAIDESAQVRGFLQQLLACEVPGPLHVAVVLDGIEDCPSADLRRAGAAALSAAVEEFVPALSGHCASWEILRSERHLGPGGACALGIEWGLNRASCAIHAAPGAPFEADALRWFDWARRALLDTGLAMAASAWAACPVAWTGQGIPGEMDVERARQVVDDAGLINKYVFSETLPAESYAVTQAGWERFGGEVARAESPFRAARFFADAGFRCALPVIGRVRAEGRTGFASGDSDLAARWFEPFEGDPASLEELATMAGAAERAGGRSGIFGAPVAPALPEAEQPRQTTGDLLTLVVRELAPRAIASAGANAAEMAAFAASGASLVVAADVAPSCEAMAFEQQGGIVLIRETIEQAAAGGRLDAVLGETPVDLAWIGSERRFPAALRAFIDLERRSDPFGAIVIGHVAPRSLAGGARAGAMGLWSGDAWRIVPCLRRWRPDLVLDLHDVEPDGALVVTGLDPDNRVLEDRYDEIAAAEPPDWPEYNAELLVWIVELRRARMGNTP